MKVTIEGNTYDIPDDDVLEYADELRGEEGEGNRFVFGIHVTHTKELAAMGGDIADFMRTIGEGSAEVHVSVNAKLNEIKDKVMGFTTDAIGFVDDSDDEYYYEDEDEE